MALLRDSAGNLHRPTPRGRATPNVLRTIPPPDDSNLQPVLFVTLGNSHTNTNPVVFTGFLPAAVIDDVRARLPIRDGTTALADLMEVFNLYREAHSNTEGSLQHETENGGPKD